MRRLFIIGGSDAGISSALRAREFAPEWQVTVAVADRYPNFSICGIPYFLSQEVPKAENLAHRKAADIQSLGVELLLDHKVERIDSSAHRVIVRRPGRHYFRTWLRQARSCYWSPLDPAANHRHGPAGRVSVALDGRYLCI